MPKRPTIDDIRRNTRSRDTRRLNPEIFGAVDQLESDQHGQPSRTLERKTPQKRRSSIRPPKGVEVIVTIVAHIVRRMDDDNLAHACKPLRDAIADELGIDDGDSRLRWEYGQVETRGSTGVMVRAEISP